ncbi:MAG: membrane protein insertion efficiency factor YidD [Candidatus Delongbacteria bacterium]|nr:membrane protein insertion efficiency factor YidD [Candidatus Delongbacteria bacterium]
MKVPYLIILLLNCLLFSNDFDWGWSEPELYYNGVWEEQSKNTSNKESFYSKWIWFYKNNVSPKQGERCPCFPTCSTYTLYSMNEYGFLTGFLMGMDRIFIRENQEMLKLKHYNKIERCRFNNLTLKDGVYDIPEANNIFSNKDWRTVNPYFYFRIERDACSESTDK